VCQNGDVSKIILIKERASAVRRSVMDEKPEEVNFSMSPFAIITVRLLFELAPIATHAVRAALARSGIRDPKSLLTSSAEGGELCMTRGFTISINRSSGTRTGISDDPYGSQISTIV